MQSGYAKLLKYTKQILVLAGKPILFLFTIIGVSLLAYLHLLTLFTRKIARLRFPSIHLSLPRVRVPLPHQFFRPLSLLGFFLPCFLLLTFYFLILKDLPHPTSLSILQPSLSTKIYDRHGTLLYKIYGNENRTLVSLSGLPRHLIHATISAEDQNFYSHPGLDLRGILRAARNNLACRLSSSTCTSALQGGSTITQQLIKNTIGESDKTLRRKLREAVLALWVERFYTKDQILEMYLNNIPYGGTSYGVEEASQEFFGHPASELNLAESAMLAGLPVAPTTLSPFGTTPFMAKIRQRQVLERMVLDGHISENQKVNAESAALAFHPQGIEIKAPHFVMYVKSLLVSAYGETAVERGGLEITTTLDYDLQTLLQNSIVTELNQLSRLKVGNGAGMIAAPSSGHILAMVGSRDFFDTEHDGQVNVPLMSRQPGSSIKPLTYSLALLRGLTPSTMLEDSPICFHSRGSPDYCPVNYDNTFHGSVTLATALASSYNVPAVKLLNSLGVGNLISLGRELGITTWNDSSRFGLSLTLGGGEVTMYDLVQVYSVFANQGVKIPLTAVLEVKDHTGRPLAFPGPPPGGTVQAAGPQEVLPPSVAYQISSILADPAARAPAFGAHSVLNLPGHTVSVKTGTTNSLRDNWTIGYTPNFLVAAWVGNNDNSPMSRVASGITGASPIWAAVMSKLLADQPNHPLSPPSNMVRIPLCPSDHSYYCPGLCNSPPVYEYFVSGTAPRPDCARRGTIELSPGPRSQH